MTDNKTITDIFPTGLYAQHDLMTAEENDLLMQKINSMREKYGRGNTNDWFSGVSSPDNCFKLACLTKEALCPRGLLDSNGINPSLVTHSIEKPLAPSNSTPRVSCFEELVGVDFE